MKLTPQELEFITPGIYRVSHLPYQVPDVKNPNDEFLNRLNEVKARSISHPTLTGKTYPCFVKTPDEFLELWYTSYNSFPGTAKEHHDPGFLSYGAKGFELFYANWHEDQPYYVIGGREMVFKAGDFKRPQYVMLASDGNGMSDMRGHMNVGINDYVNERVLVWRGKYLAGRGPGGVGGIEKPIKYRDIQFARKLLHDDIHFYVWDGPDKFPFHSPNLLKAAGASGGSGTWTLIGYEPQDVYAAFQKLGFVFPPVRNAANKP